jgi:mono/diheme cytochrome c family protein
MAPGLQLRHAVIEVKGEITMNRTTLEYMIMALFIGLGTPVFAIWGALDGEKLALVAYPKPKAEVATTAFDPKAVFLTSADNVAKGEALYKANCISCHGENADGQGPAAKALTPPPRNFLSADERWTIGRNPQEIFLAISKGSPGTGMAGFSAMLKPEDRWAIVHYLGTLSGVQGQYEPVAETSFDELRKLSGL